MENEERKEEINKSEDIKVVEGTIVGGSQNSTQNSQNMKTDKEVSNKKGLCIASLVLGIVSLVFCCAYIISIPCAILALIFGIIGLKSEGKGMAIAGIITSAITMVIMIFFFIFCFIIGFSIGINDILSNDDIDSSYDTYNYDYNSIYDSYREKFNL